MWSSTSVYGLIGGWVASPSTYVTKSDDEPTLLTLVGHAADS